ncbi:MAG: hypothetical protein RIA69_19830 [Cyclobacteriaceae bacterium]
MKYLAVLIFSICCLFESNAQIGKTFPDLEGENLSHNEVLIPKSTRGKYTLIGMAYSKKAEDYLKTWFSPTYNLFLDKEKEPSIFDVSYDVNVYFIPMFTGAKRVAYKKVMENVEKDIDERLHPYVLFYNGSIKEYESALDFDGKKVPYFYVLDENGKIVYTTSGVYTTSKMQEIVDSLPF